MQKLVSEVFDFFVVIHACPSISADTRSPSSVRPHGSSAQTSGCSVEGEKMMLLKCHGLCVYSDSPLNSTWENHGLYNLYPGLWPPQRINFLLRSMEHSNRSALTHAQ